MEDFIVDPHTWAIKYIEVNTRNWWRGKKVLMSPHWIERVSWTNSKIYVDLSRETIKNGPEYIDPVTREHENTAYWLRGTEQPYSPRVSNGPEYIEPVTRDSEKAYWLQGTEQPYSPKVSRD